MYAALGPEQDEQDVGQPHGTVTHEFYIQEYEL